MTRDSVRVTRDSTRDSTVMTRAQLCVRDAFMSRFAEGVQIGTEGITCDSPVVSESQARRDAAEAEAV